MFDFYTKTAKIRKYPTAAAAMVFAAVFSFLLASPQAVRSIDFYLVWVLSLLSGCHIWYMFQADRSYRVSGIVPAWLELLLGTMLLFWCPIREISLILVMLAVCSYAAGIIYSVKMTIPLILYLGVAPGVAAIGRVINDIMLTIADQVWFLFTGSGMIADPVYPGTARLFWAFMLAVFPLTVLLCKSAYDRFTTYCVALPVFVGADLLRMLLVKVIPGIYAPEIALLIALITAEALIALLLFLVNRLSNSAKGENSDETSR